MFEVFPALTRPEKAKSTAVSLASFLQDKPEGPSGPKRKGLPHRSLEQWHGKRIREERKGRECKASCWYKMVMKECMDLASYVMVYRSTILASWRLKIEIRFYMYYLNNII